MTWITGVDESRHLVAPQPAGVGEAVQQHDRAARAADLDVDPDPVDRAGDPAALPHLSRRPARAALRARGRVAARAGRHRSPGSSRRAPSCVITTSGRSSTPAMRRKPRRTSGSFARTGEHRLGDLPLRVVGLIRPTLHERLGLGQPVPVERERGAVPGLDRLGGERLPVLGQRDRVAPVVGPQQVPQRDGVQQSDRRAAADRRVGAGPRVGDEHHAGGDRVPSTTMSRWRSSIFAISVDAGRSARRRPSARPAGSPRTVRIHASVSLRPRSARRFALVTTPTPHVPLSAGSVKVEIVP